MAHRMYTVQFYDNKLNFLCIIYVLGMHTRESKSAGAQHMSMHDVPENVVPISTPLGYY